MRSFDLDRILFLSDERRGVVLKDFSFNLSGRVAHDLATEEEAVTNLQEGSIMDGGGSKLDLKVSFFSEEQNCSRLELAARFFVWRVSSKYEEALR